MEAKNIEFKVGMEIEVEVKSPYGSQYDEVKNYKVTKIRNYKNRGQKIHVDDMDLGHGLSFWKEEFQHNINLKTEMKNENVINFNEKKAASEEAKAFEVFKQGVIDMIPKMTKEDKYTMIDAMETKDLETFKETLMPYLYRKVMLEQ